MKIKSVIRSSFKNQIFFVLLTITLIMLITGSIFTIQGFQNKLISDYKERNIEQNKELTGQLYQDFSMLSQVLYDLSVSDTIIRALNKKNVTTIKVYSSIYEISADIKDFASVSIYQGSECRYSTDSSNLSIKLPDNYSILAEAERRKGKVCYSLDPTNSSSDPDILFCLKLNTTEKAAYAVIRVKQNVIAQRLQDKINARDGFILTDAYFRPYSQLGTAKNGNELAAIKKNLFSHIAYDHDSKNNIYMSEIGETGLISIYITPPALDESSSKVAYQILIIEALISILVCLIIARQLSNYLSRPISTLSQGMKRFRNGDFETMIDLDINDEFHQLAEGFNKMTSQLKETMDDRVAQERTINETRIAMMQSQLNPHFLYNTLDTIKWVTKANNIPEVSTLVASLAQILRTSISENQFCPLSKELSLVESYCKIQQIRFDNRFLLKIDVVDNILNAIIPKLILQPIVENSIIHGLEDKDDGKITVSAIKNGECLIISVEDNGCGISDDMILAIQNSEKGSLNGHIGLKNVNDILKLYYGSEYGITALRPESGGTLIRLSLPYSENEPLT